MNAQILRSPCSCRTNARADLDRSLCTVQRLGPLARLRPSLIHVSCRMASSVRLRVTASQQDHPAETSGRDRHCDAQQTSLDRPGSSPVSILQQIAKGTAVAALAVALVSSSISTYMPAPQDDEARNQTGCTL